MDSENVGRTFQKRRRRPSAEEIAEDRRRISSYLRGDLDTFREVDDWIRREIGVCYPVLRPEIEDLCQGAHEKLLQKLRDGKFGHRSSLRTYIGGIVHHTSISRIRKLYRERTPPEGWESRADDAARSPYQSLAEAEEVRLLHQVVLRSSSPCRDLWRMVLVDKLSYAEIGERLSIPPGTVKSRMWHCRRKAMVLLERLRH